MSSQLQNIADIITASAGWKNTTPDEAGVFRFSIEGGLDFQLFSPENRTAILLADLGAAPALGSIQGEDEIKRLSSVAAASLKKRRSSFAIAGDRLELTYAFPAQESDEMVIRQIMKDFLNDFAWWKQQVKGKDSNSSSNTSSSPFSLGGWFSGF